MNKQVDKTHYDFRKYITKRRWASMWHQVDEVLSDSPDKILEIGPGPGIFKALVGSFGINIETLDIDPELEPDHVASADNMPFENHTFDAVCAFQVLEHVPYETALNIFQEMARITSDKIVISLPNADRAWPFSLYIPTKGELKFYIKKPSAGSKEHIFDGQHYWEVNKKGYAETKLIKDLNSLASVKLVRSYRVKENPYHHFFIFKKSGSLEPQRPEPSSSRIT